MLCLTCPISLSCLIFAFVIVRTDSRFLTPVTLRLLGTPKNDTWENVSSLPDWQSRFPSWKKTDLSQPYAVLGTHGIALLEALLIYNPKQRIAGKESLIHEYFDDFDVTSIGTGPIA